MRNPILGVIFAGAVAYGFFGSGIHGGKPITIPDAAPGASPTAPRPVKENVVAYYTGDQAMQSAKGKGRSTLARFRALMAAGTAGAYTVKIPLTQNGKTEHIWMQLTADEGGKFAGRLANDPVNGNAYKMGDRMTVAQDDVEDWMIRDGRDIYGGYTVRAILADMPSDKAQAYGIAFHD